MVWKIFSISNACILSYSLAQAISNEFPLLTLVKPNSIPPTPEKSPPTLYCFSFRLIHTSIHAYIGTNLWVLIVNYLDNKIYCYYIFIVRNII